MHLAHVSFLKSSTIILFSKNCSFHLLHHNSQLKSRSSRGQVLWICHGMTVRRVDIVHINHWSTGTQKNNNFPSQNKGEGYIWGKKNLQPRNLSHFLDVGAASIKQCYTLVIFLLMRHANSHSVPRHIPWIQRGFELPLLIHTPAYELA